jgi:hypothetical protein
MLALVTTPRFVLLVNLVSRQVTVLEEGRQEYYGATWRPDGEQLILSHSGLENESLVDLASYARSEVGWISEGDAHSGRFLSQPHQILCAPDGRVICTNTGRNSLVVIDSERPGYFQEARLHSDRWDRLEPQAATGLHLNSVFLRDNTLTVLAHGFEHGSQLITLDYPSLERRESVVIPGATGMHNYCVTARDERISCVSSRGMLIDPHSLHVHWRSGSAGYLRGLAVGGGRVLVGNSPQAGRHLRSSAVSGLWVIDRESWRAIDYIVLGPYGVVNDVRLIDVADEAHHGHPFRGGPTLQERDAWQQVVTTRLSGSRRLTELVAEGPFDLALGGPQVSDDGWLCSPDELCLMLTRDQRPQELRLRYDFQDQPEGGHCGVVVGCGATVHEASPSQRDANMDVIVATQSGGNSVSLAHWQHDGSGWNRLGILAEVAGLSGMLAVRRGDDDLVIEAGPQREGVAVLPLERVPHADQRWGVRWQATRVMPEHAPQQGED